MAKVQIAVAGIPDLPAALRDVGISVLTNNTDPRAVAPAVREVDSAESPVVVIALTDDARQIAWAEMLIAEGRRVVCVGQAVAGSRASIDLPVTVADLLAPLGRPRSAAQEEDALIVDALTIVRPWMAATQDVDDFVWEDEPAPVASPRMIAAEEPWDVSEPAAEVRRRPQPQPEPAADQPQWTRPLPSATTGQPWGESPVRQHELDDQTPVQLRPTPTPMPVAPSEPADETWGRHTPQAEPARQTVQDQDQPSAVQPEQHAPRPRYDTERQPDTGFVEHSVEPVRTGNGRLAPVVVCLSAKGGVGKGTFSALLAQRAAQMAHLDPRGEENKVVLVDGSRGQGGQLVIAAVGRGVGTIYDYAVRGGDPRSAIVSPAQINASRPARLEPLSYGCVFAPREGQSDSSIVTSDDYARAVQAAREVAHLVIIDTQIMEDFDTSGLWENVWIPLLASSGGWGLMVMDASVEAREKTPQRFRMLRRLGASTRIMYALNRISPALTLEDGLGDLVASYAQFAEFAGVVHQSDRIAMRFERGSLPHDEPEMAAALDRILFEITGDQTFNADLRPAAAAGSGRGWLGKLLRKAR